MPKNYINLKEASHISGYSADYIGQLIRGGKIPGKQVYSNVSWMVSKEDLEEYLRKKNTGKGSKDNIRTFFLKNISGNKLSSVYNGFFYAVIFILSLFIVFLFYVFAVNLDNRIEMEGAGAIESQNQ